ncbi:helix-turn-helix transcriptional regulator [bacterium]|nr:helix-turn-helix transcriptional regulator [bacterium]
MFFEDKNFIAKKIRLARKNAKLTQEELAEKVGITSKQLSRIESSTHVPSLFTFFKIVEILKIDLNDFGITNNTQSNPIREEIDKILNNLTDNELMFYLEMIKTLSQNVELLKK